MTCATIVVPCYNETQRLDEGAFFSLVDSEPALRLLFVDDGSTDETLARIQAMAARRPEKIRVLTLPTNHGKAEAVRLGLLEALRGSESIVGYTDADLATPIQEIRRLVETLVQSEADVLIAARISILGVSIERSLSRHYLGRVFATLASLILRVRVYDTQCGAKFFRRGSVLESALATPFISRWAFDIELLGRMLIGSPEGEKLAIERIIELPLRVWRDVPGSKLKPLAMLMAAGDLARIALDLGDRRHQGMTPLGRASSGRL